MVSAPLLGTLSWGACANARYLFSSEIEVKNIDNIQGKGGQGGGGQEEQDLSQFMLLLKCEQWSEKIMLV